MKTKIAHIFIISFVLLFITARVAEAKMLPRFQSETGEVKSASISTASVSSITVNPRFMYAKSGLVVTFGNLQNAENVSYMLVYDTNNNTEGVTGQLILDGESTKEREIQFGTCSGIVCVFHENITNMKLTVTSELKNGSMSVKRYRIQL